MFADRLQHKPLRKETTQRGVGCCIFSSLQPCVPVEQGASDSIEREDSGISRHTTQTLTTPRVVKVKEARVVEPTAQIPPNELRLLQDERLP